MRPLHLFFSRHVRGSLPSIVTLFLVLSLLASCWILFQEDDNLVQTTASKTLEWANSLPQLPQLPQLPHSLQGRSEEPSVIKEIAEPRDPKQPIRYAACILSAVGNHEKRALWRRLVVKSMKPRVIDYAFVVANSHIQEVHDAAVAEAARYGDMLFLSDIYDDFRILSHKSLKCLHHFAHNSNADVILKVDDDTFVHWQAMVMELDRAIGSNTTAVYVGLYHNSSLVANPDNFEGRPVKTRRYFEFDYTGVFWPAFMQGGFYGLSSDLAKQVAIEGRQTFMSEDATVGVAVSGLVHRKVPLTRNLFLYTEGTKKNGERRVICVLQCGLVCLTAHLESVQNSGHTYGLAYGGVEVLNDSGAKMLQNHDVCFPRESNPPLPSPHPFRQHPVPDIVENGEWWKNMKGSHKHQRVFLIGNGPSLNRLPLHLLTNEKIMVFNRFYLMQERIRSVHPFFYACMDSVVCPDIRKELMDFTQSSFAAFMPYEFGGNKYYEKIGTGPMMRWFWFGHGKHIFEKTRKGYHRMRVASQGTVASTGLEILAHLGFSKIYILGVDMTYSSHKGSVDAVKDGIVWKSTADTDADHFDHRYFGANRTFKDPNVEGVMLPSFVQAKRVIEEQYPDISVFNAGVGGALEIFPRKPFRNVINRNFPDEMKLLLKQMPVLHARDLDMSTIADKAPAVSLKKVFVNSVVREDCSTTPLTDFIICNVDPYISNFKNIIDLYIPYGPVGDEVVLLSREYDAVSVGC